MGKLAFVFPGQGSQYVGMGSELYRAHHQARETFEQAEKRLGLPIARLCFKGPESELSLTANTQPAILTVSLAAWRIVDSEGIKPDVVAGHSLGEYSALVAAGCLGLGDAAYAVRRRGELMQEAVPVGQGAMAAIIGMGTEEVASICCAAAEGEVLELANVNCPGQIVIAGQVGAVGRAVEIARKRGAKRALRLQVSAPFHSSLMRPAQDGMRGVLAAIPFGPLAVPLVNNADVELLRDGEAARRGLVKQVVSPVRWEETVRRVVEMGIDTVVEFGPGRVLCGLIKRIDRSVACLNVEDVESLGATLSALRMEE